MSNPDDDLIIIDKEFVIGFRKLFKNLRKHVATTYGEVDFLGLNWDGELIIMELKGNDPGKTSTAPIQAGFINVFFLKY